MTADTMELGYRIRPREWFTVDTEGFFTKVRDFRDLAVHPSPSGVEVFYDTTDTQYTQAGATTQNTNGVMVRITIGG